eukprot:scaffold4034_cov142-Skeletonema_menzelii.AAC.1
MAPIIFTRTKAERRPRRIITKDLFKPQEEEELSPLEMEKKFVVCKSPEGTTPETVDSMVMTFSDDSFDENDDDDGGDWFGDACQFDENWWEGSTPPAKNNITTTNKFNEAMTPFSKLAMESTGRRLPLSPLDTNTGQMPQPDIKPIKMNKKDTVSSRRKQDSSKENNCISPFLFSKHKSAFTSQANNKEDNNTANTTASVKSSAEIKADLDAFWRSTKTARQPYVSPFSKNTLARNAEGKHTMPPIYSACLFTPVKEKSLTTPFSKHKNRRGSPLGLTKIVEGDDEPRDDDDDELAIDALASYDIWGAKEVDNGVGSDSLTSSCCDTWGLVVKDVREDSFDAGDGLLSNFLHNFMVSTPPKKKCDRA